MPPLNYYANVVSAYRYREGPIGERLEPIRVGAEVSALVAGPGLEERIAEGGDSATFDVPGHGGGECNGRAARLDERRMVFRSGRVCAHRAPRSRADCPPLGTMTACEYLKAPAGGLMGVVRNGQNGIPEGRQGAGGGRPEGRQRGAGGATAGEETEKRFDTAFLSAGPVLSALKKLPEYGLMEEYGKTLEKAPMESFKLTHDPDSGGRLLQQVRKKAEPLLAVVARHRELESQNQPLVRDIQDEMATWHTIFRLLQADPDEMLAEGALYEATQANVDEQFALRDARLFNTKVKFASAFAELEA